MSAKSRTAKLIVILLGTSNASAVPCYFFSKEAMSIAGATLKVSNILSPSQFKIPSKITNDASGGDDQWCYTVGDSPSKQWCEDIWTEITPQWSEVISPEDPVAASRDLRNFDNFIGRSVLLRRLEWYKDLAYIERCTSIFLALPKDMPRSAVDALNSRSYPYKIGSTNPGPYRINLPGAVKRLFRTKNVTYNNFLFFRSLSDFENAFRQALLR